MEKESKVLVGGESTVLVGEESALSGGEMLLAVVMVGYVSALVLSFLMNAVAGF